MSNRWDSENDSPVGPRAAAASRRFASSRKFIVPRTSSGPQRPQFETRFAAAATAPAGSVRSSSSGTHASSSAKVSLTQSAMKPMTCGKWSRPMCSVAPSSGVKIRSSRFGLLTAWS